MWAYAFTERVHLHSMNFIRLPHIFNIFILSKLDIARTVSYILLQKEQEMKPVNEVLYTVLLLRIRVDRNNIVLCPQINFLVCGKTFASPVHVPN